MGARKEWCFAGQHDEVMILVEVLMAGESRTGLWGQHETMRIL